MQVKLNGMPVHVGGGIVEQIDHQGPCSLLLHTIDGNVDQIGEDQFSGRHQELLLVLFLLAKLVRLEKLAY